MFAKEAVIAFGKEMSGSETNQTELYVASFCCFPKR
jgi:hypothetical protein